MAGSRDRTDLARMSAVPPRPPEPKERLGFLGRGLWASPDDGGDDREEYLGLWESLRADLRPRGALEQLLVEVVASCLLRKRRILQAERGIINIQQKEVERETQSSSSGYAGYDPGWLGDEYDGYGRRSAVSVEELLVTLDALEKEIKQHGCLAKSSVNPATQLWDPASRNELGFRERLRRLNELATGEEAPESDEPPAKKCRAAMLKLVDEERQRLLAGKEAQEQREAAERHAELDAKAVPDHETVRTLAMHGRRLDQELRVALVQLERLQRARMGDALYALTRLLSTASGVQLQRLTRLTCTRLTLQTDGDMVAAMSQEIRLSGDRAKPGERT